MAADIARRTVAAARSAATRCSSSSRSSCCSRSTRSLLQALKSGPDSLDHPRSLLPVDLTLSTIRAAWDQGDLGRLLLNSLFVSHRGHLGVIVTSLLAAYAFAFLRVPAQGADVRRSSWPRCSCPREVTVVINQRTADSLGLDQLATRASSCRRWPARSVCSSCARCSCSCPSELREAAALDGVGHLRFLWEVAAPLSRPTLGALGLFTFLGTWNAYLWPSQVIRGDRAHETIQIGLERLKNNDISKLNLVTGGLVVAALPIFIMLVVFQRQLVRGLTAGAVKG